MKELRAFTTLFFSERSTHRLQGRRLIYTQLVNFKSDEFHVKTAKTIEDARKLIEAGFHYVTTMDGYQIFRKRK